MKFVTTIFAIAIAELVIASSDAALKGPYNSAYDQYCGGGKTNGIFEINGTPFTYECDTDITLGVSAIHERSADACAENCSDGSCDTAVWDYNTGDCWTSNGSTGSKRSRAGFMLLTSDALAGCQAKLSASPNCPANNKKLATVNGKVFMLHCDTDSYLTQGKNAIGTTDTMEECMKKCTQTSGCSFIMWTNDSHRCYIANPGENFANGENSYGKDYETAEIVDV